MAGNIILRYDCISQVHEGKCLNHLSNRKKQHILWLCFNPVLISQIPIAEFALCEVSLWKFTFLGSFLSLWKKNLNFSFNSNALDWINHNETCS